MHKSLIYFFLFYATNLFGQSFHSVGIDRFNNDSTHFYFERQSENLTVRYINLKTKALFVYEGKVDSLNNFKVSNALKHLTPDSNNFIEGTLGKRLTLCENGKIKKLELQNVVDQFSLEQNPYELKKLLKRTKNNGDLYQVLTNHVFGEIKEDFPTVFYSYWHSYQEGLSLEMDDFGVDVFEKNLFGDSTNEALVQIRTNNSCYIVLAFYKENNEWHRVEDFTLIQRESWNERPCDYNIDNDNLISFWFEEARTNGEFLIAGNFYSGHCGNYPRGSNVRYFVWQITKNGFYQLYEGIKYNSSYSYQPDYTPEENQYKFLSENDSYPKKLQVTNLIHINKADEDEEPNIKTKYIKTLKVLDYE